MAPVQARIRILLGAWGAGPGGQSIVEGGVIPCPRALARKANFASRATPSVPGDGVEPPLGDPEMKCWMTGVPRMMSPPYPAADRQTPNAVLITQEFNGKRASSGWTGGGNAGRQYILHGLESRAMGGRLARDRPAMTSDKNWLDRAGNFLSDTAHVVERLTAASPYHIAYTTTIEDEKVFSRPWKISFPLSPDGARRRLMEFKCQPFVEELV